MSAVATIAGNAGLNMQKWGFLIEAKKVSGSAHLQRLFFRLAKGGRKSSAACHTRAAATRLPPKHPLPTPGVPAPAHRPGCEGKGGHS